MINKIIDFFKSENKKEIIKNYLKSDDFKAMMKETLDTVIFVVVGVSLIRFFLFEIRWIPSGSMRPTIKEGDRVVVDRLTRFFKTPERGDIMVFYPPFIELKNSPVLLFKRLTGFFCKDVAFIKRVIALPGEKFEIKVDNTGAYTVFINDEPLQEDYVRNRFEYSKCEDAAVECGPIIIPEHNYMMLGDNRDNSKDSRFWGTLDEKYFIGKAVVRFFPFNRMTIFNYPYKLK